MKIIISILFIIVIGLVHPARSQTCTATALPIIFGNYRPTSGISTLSTGTVTVTCQTGLLALLFSYQISLSTGSSGSYSSRSMTGGASPLRYQLYTNVLLNQVWGDGTAGTSPVAGGVTLGVLATISTNYTVYGQIPASQNVVPGTYADVITVIVSY